MWTPEVFMITLTVVAMSSQVTVGWGSDDKILLKDISVLTLYHGRMTNARRSSAIPQIKCVGGSAGCNSFTPQVVQCYNRGSDGYDVQWECKTDMDNAYRFGRVEVSCEGYDYADDIHVLKGSCGLEYTLDLTKEGYAQKNQGHHSYYGNDHSYTKSRMKGSSMIGDLVTLAIVGVIIYAIYVTCLSGNDPGSGTGGTDYRRSHGERPYPSAPPPPGFRDEYTTNTGGCSSSYGYNTYPNTGARTGSTGGGFWSGMATGGMMGYLFGSRNNTGYGYQHPGSTWGSGWGSGAGSSWGSGWGGGSSSSWGSGRSSSSSTGTRTASGFGGTKRR